METALQSFASKVLDPSSVLSPFFGSFEQRFFRVDFSSRDVEKSNCKKGWSQCITDKREWGVVFHSTPERKQKHGHSSEEESTRIECLKGYGKKGKSSETVNMADKNSTEVDCFVREWLMKWYVCLCVWGEFEFVSEATVWLVNRLSLSVSSASQYWHPDRWLQNQLPSLVTVKSLTEMRT